MTSVIGQEIAEVEFVKSERSGRSGVKAAKRIYGRYSFPDSHGPQPQDGDIWKVEIAGENPSGSVYFLRCISRVSTRAEREAAWQKEQEERQRIFDERKAMSPQVNEALQAFTSWEDKEPTISLKKYGKLPVEISSKTIYVKEGGLDLTYTAQAKWEGAIVPDAQVEQTFSIPWSELEMDTDSLWGVANLTENKRAIECRIKTVRFGDLSVRFDPFMTNAEWGQFIEWELVPNQVRANIRLTLPNGFSQDFNILVGEFKDGNIRWEERPERHYFWYHIVSLTPEPGPEQIAHLKNTKRSYEEQGKQNQAAGLLTVPTTVYHKLKELGVAGVGITSYASENDDEGNEKNHPEHSGMIHPDLLPLFEGARSWSGPAEFPPLVMHSMVDQEKAWREIEWPNGFLPKPEQIEAIRTGQTKKVELVDQEELDDWLRDRQESGVEAEIVAIDGPIEKYGTQYKYRFDAIVQYPHRVVVTLTNDLGFNKVLVSDTIELHPHTIEGISHGNEHFAGKVTLQPELVKYRRKSCRWEVSWTAPETKEETAERKVEAIRSLINAAREHEIVLSGWRYTDTNNPVVYINWDRIWYLREFDRETFSTSKRKGFGSNKGEIYSATPAIIRQGLEDYKSYGWPVAPDDDWEDKAGKSILSFFPEELIKKMEGGA